MMRSSASRGIGLELVRQLLESPANLVVAACRSPETATALRDLDATAKGTLHTVKLDVSDSDGVQASAKELEPVLEETGLDYLINNAGIVRTAVFPLPVPHSNLLVDCHLFIANAGRRRKRVRPEPGRPDAYVPHQCCRTGTRLPGVPAIPREEREEDDPQHLKLRGQPRNRRSGWHAEHVVCHEQGGPEHAGTPLSSPLDRIRD